MPVPLKVKGIGTSKHKLDHFALTILYILGINKKSHKIYVSITYKLHLVDRLKANMLVKNDMLCTESFAITFYNSSTLIHSYSIKIDINTKQHSKFLKHRTLTNTSTIIPPHSEALVAFQRIKLPDSCDFLFSPASQQYLTLYSYLFDHISTKVLVCNDIGYTIKIPLHHQLGCVTKLPYKSYFATSINLDVVSKPLISPTIFHDYNGISIPSAEDMETELLNSIKIYRDKEAVDMITRLIDDYLSIWESLDFIQILPECWIKVYLKPRWETKISNIKPKVYPLGIKAKCLINETFDKIQHLGHLKYTTSHIPFSFPMFVVYKTNIKGEKKRHPIVNIHKLNDLVVLDIYSLPLQSDIIASVQGYTNLAILDIISFFYQ